MDYKNKKCLIAYFSRAGNNFVAGEIVNLPVGNTEVAAKTIAGMTGGRLHRIVPENDYPADYTECTEVAQKELSADARPPLKGSLENIGEYEFIFLGYPNWWGTMPMPVWTFLEEHDFSGKTILPFCTHEGSRLAGSEQDIARLCPGAVLLQGIAIQGGKVRHAADDIREWLENSM